MYFWTRRTYRTKACDRKQNDSNVVRPIRVYIYNKGAAKLKMTSTSNQTSTANNKNTTRKAAVFDSATNIERETKRTRLLASLVSGDELRQDLRIAETDHPELLHLASAPQSQRMLLSGHQAAFLPNSEALWEAQLLAGMAQQAHTIPQRTLQHSGSQIAPPEGCLLNAIVLNRSRREQELLLQSYHRLAVPSRLLRTLPQLHDPAILHRGTSAQQMIDRGQLQTHGFGGATVAGTCTQQACENPSRKTDATFVYQESWPRQPQTLKQPEGIPHFPGKISKPRRPLTAFNLFFKEERLKLKEEYESLSFRFLGQEISRRWKTLKDRTKYRDLALAEKQRYSSEMEVYKRSMQDALTKAFDQQMEKVPESAYQDYLERLKEDEKNHRQRRNRR